jgi:beta-galactosidase
MDCTNKKVQIIYGDVNLGVCGENGKFHYIFSYSAGGPVSFVSDGIEWLYRVPQPTFWRALTDNDRGNGFHLKSGMWLSADMFIKCVKVKVLVDGEEIPMPTAPENNKYTEEEYAGSVCVTYFY